MNKQETIKSLRQNIDGQDFTMTRLRNCINLKREKDIIDIFHQNSTFGIFFYDDKNKLRVLLGSILFDGISKYYEQWRVTYNSIFDILLEDKTAKKLKLKKITNQDEDIIKAIYDDLLTIHENLKKQCEISFARLNALADDKFN